MKVKSNSSTPWLNLAFTVFSKFFNSQLITVKQALHYPFNWNQLVVEHNLLKHVGCYTFQLIAGHFLFSYHVSAFMVNTVHSFLLSISWKVWTCLIFSTNWNQFLICWKPQSFRYYITQLVDLKKSNSIKRIV